MNGIVRDGQGVEIGTAVDVQITPAATGAAEEGVLASPNFSGSMTLEMQDTSFYEKARASVAHEITIDVAPMLRDWLDHPTDFAERVVFGRYLSDWERKRVINARWRYDIPEGMDLLDALKEIAVRMRAALGATPHAARKLRKREHLKMLRHFRSHPESFHDVTYRHRFIRTRCGVCRALYATETFISFYSTIPGASPRRRMYCVEHEDILDCGHPSVLLYPVEWEADGYVSPNGANA